MNKTLLLPVAGRSSRFPGMRPKWLLTMPDGKLMIEKAISLLDISKFDRVVIIALKEHIDKYLSQKGLNEILEGMGHPQIDLCILDEPTNSQSETIACAIKRCAISGSIFIKDCDNMFYSDFNGGNEVSVVDLNKTDLIDAKNKSYVELNSLGGITNIVEKQVISNYFCCGGYGFSSAENFIEHYSRIDALGEIYISNVIYSMLMGGAVFMINPAKNYVDWGTLREYRHYNRSFLTIFCDVDGVILNNGSKFGPVGWSTAPIVENLEIIKKMKDQGRLYLVITSSRPEVEKIYIAESLNRFGIIADQYVMGLPHTRRILVNDFSLTNPYPTAVAINLERDSKLLSSILGSVIDN